MTTEKVIHHRDPVHCLSCRLAKEFGQPYPKVHTHPISKVPS